MYWANFLHIYQPPTQTETIVRKVTEECYRTLVRVLSEAVLELATESGEEYHDAFRELSRAAEWREEARRSILRSRSGNVERLLLKMYDYLFETLPTSLSCYSGKHSDRGGDRKGQPSRPSLIAAAMVCADDSLPTRWAQAYHCQMQTGGHISDRITDFKTDV